MKAVILNFTGGRENWGCQATSWGLHGFLIRHLSPLGLRDLSVVPYPPRHWIDNVIERKHKARIAAIQTAAAPTEDDLRFLEKLAARRFGAMLNRVRDADVVFFQGEGTMGPSRLFGRLNFFTLPLLARHLYGKPVFSLNQSFVVDGPAAAIKAGTIFGSFDMVALRESRSYALARSLGLDAALLCPDMAFVAPEADKPLPGRPMKPGYFCITGSAALSRYDIGAYLAGLKRIADAQGLNPVFVYSAAGDRALYDSAIAAWGPGSCAVISSREVADYRGLLPVLRGAALVVGGRYHTTVAALSQHTPVIPTAGNSHKSEGLSALLGMNLTVVDHDRPEALAARAKELLADRDATQRQVASGVARVRTQIDGFGAYLAAAVKARLEGNPMPLPPPELQPMPEAQSSTASNDAVYRGRGGSGLKRRLHPTDVLRAVEDMHRRLSLQHNLAVYDVPTQRF
ncbi:polysaccharide pyruvyl transferase family protein [Rhodobacter ferrooxidans]|uniref:Polysaccharide pyruvyl transferase domain-containing protein n=1 Tax=Rhodobacter ferrooxidans TaxID=371731 RepID=C8S063_9RHOB|nr:polysaccharide pyruvyl transferase family protein [Rhodobacter sp. SW2]EEW25672.1 conserved hypothetical protein [Rhodobacter sp. SW2]